MTEIRTAIHLTTKYTSGSASHADLLAQAIAAGLDAVITTDHNLLVQDIDGYAKTEKKTCLILTAEELFDRGQQPPRNRLMVMDTRHEMAPYAANPQQLAKRTIENSGLSFLSHPFAAEKTALGALLPPWTVEEIPDGIKGIEIWNSLSELQEHATNRLLAWFFSRFPRLVRRGPNRQACQYWDKLLATGEKITAIAGSGLGALPGASPRLKHYLLGNISNRLILPAPLSGSLAEDRRMVFRALRKGHTYIACDDLVPAEGFRFTAQARDENGNIGDTVILKDSVTFQVRLPQPAKCLLYRDGELVQQWQDSDICVHNSTTPGAYRVEVFLPWLTQDVTWILTNPIYVRPYVPAPLRDQLYDSY